MSLGGGTLGPAGEQFINNTPWANPNHDFRRVPSVAAQPGMGPVAVPAGFEPLARPPAVSSANGQGTPHLTSGPSHMSADVLSMADVLAHDMPHTKQRAVSVGIRRGSKAAQAQDAPSRRDTAMTVAS